MINAPASANDGLHFEASQTFLWDTNPLLLTDNETEILGSETELSAIFLRETPTVDLDTEFKVRRGQFDQSEFNSTDFFFDGSITKNSKRWMLEFDSNVAFDTTRVSSFSIFNTRVEDRLTWEVAPSLTYNLSPRSTFALNGSWRERTFEEDSTLTDFRTLALSSVFAHRVTRRQTALFFLQAQQFQAVEENQDVDSIGPSIGWQYQHSPRLMFDLSGGFLASRFIDFPQTDDDFEINPVYSATVNYSGNRNNTELSAVRSRRSLSNGTEVDLTTLSLQNLFRINPKLDFDTRLQYEDAEQPNNLVADDLDQAYKGFAALHYDVTRQFRFSFTQEYRKEELIDDRGEADRYIARLELKYKFGAGR